MDAHCSWRREAEAERLKFQTASLSNWFRKTFGLEMRSRGDGVPEAPVLVAGLIPGHQGLRQCGGGASS
eukprot:11207403-Alexandrium_andersonii.AAC.1